MINSEAKDVSESNLVYTRKKMANEITNYKKI